MPLLSSQSGLLGHAKRIKRVWLPWRNITRNALFLVHVQVTFSLFFIVAFAVTPNFATAETMHDSPNNLSSPMIKVGVGNVNNTPGQVLLNPHHQIRGQNNSSSNSSVVRKGSYSIGAAKAKPTQSYQEHTIPREFPVALVTAASVAAFCILVFFLFAYIWHTRQLDSRARKLAIRLAADVEDGRRNMARGGGNTCRKCGANGGRLASSSSSGKYTLAPPLKRPDSASSSHHEHGQYEPLTCRSGGGGAGDDERGIIGPESISGRSSVGVSESEAGDCEDVFEPATTFPGIPSDRFKGLRGGGRGAHRKWSRSKKSYSGPSMEKRDSAVTDKEILTHFASRRHSTFFI